MKIHSFQVSWLWKEEAVFLFGFATGRVNYRPYWKSLYSFRLFLGLFKIELCWKTGKLNTDGEFEEEEE